MNECGQATDGLSKRGVTLDVERHCNSTDRLTSLVNKMNVKMDKKEPHISLGVIKIDQEATVEAGSKIFSPTIGLLAETETEQEGITYNNTNSRSNFRDRSRDNYRCDNR